MSRSRAFAVCTATVFLFVSLLYLGISPLQGSVYTSRSAVTVENYKEITKHNAALTSTLQLPIVFNQFPPPPQILFISNRDNLPNDIFDLYLMDLEGGNVRRLTTAGESSNRPAWSPDFKKIAFERAGQLFIYDLHTEGETQITNDPNHKIKSDLVWSHDGSKIAYQTDYYVDESTVDLCKGGIFVYDLELDQLNPLWITCLGATNTGLVWSHDDAKIYFSTRSVVGVYATTIDGGTQEILFESLQMYPTALAISRDGSKIAIVDSSFQIYVGPLDGTNPEVEFYTLRRNFSIGDIHWGMNDQYLVFDTQEYRNVNFDFYRYPSQISPDGITYARIPTFRPENVFEDEVLVGWARDGGSYLLQTYNNSDYDIYIVDLDQQTVVNLTGGLPKIKDIAVGWSHQ